MLGQATIQDIKEIPMIRQLAHPATAIALLALFLGGAGGALAAREGLIGSAQIKDHSIRLADLSPSAIAALRGRQGEPGPAGANGTFVTSTISRVLGTQVNVPPGQVVSATATCPPGQVAVGGGGSGSIGRLGGSTATVSGGDPVPNGWAIVVYNDQPISIPIQAMVVCAAP
jgi:hypothetical protein